MPISCGKFQTSKRRHQRRATKVSHVSARSVPPRRDKDELFSDKEWAGIVKKLGISPREGDVARCVFAGLRDRQIAEKLGVSLGTVQTHMCRIYKKLAIHKRIALMKRIFLLHELRQVGFHIYEGKRNDSR